MSPTHKEKMRWQFAGQALNGILADTNFPTGTNAACLLAVEYANDLIAELEKTALKEENKVELVERWDRLSNIKTTYCKACESVLTSEYVDHMDIKNIQLSPEPRLTPLVACDHVWKHYELQNDCIKCGATR